MGFPASVADKALAASGRCCCICHKFYGTKIELHHIKQKAYGGEDTFENCIPLCLDCHADMGKGDSKHPKGKRYSEAELIVHRDAWYKQRARDVKSAGIVGDPLEKREIPNLAGGITLIIGGRNEIDQCAYDEMVKDIQTNGNKVKY